MSAAARRDPSEGPVGAEPAIAAAGPFVGEDLVCRRGERLVFAGLAFSLQPGGALMLTGANGSGKSSLLRLAAGLLAPAAGRLFWGTVRIDDDRARHHARLHYVGHLDAVKPAMTPRETLIFWAELRGLRRARAAGGLDRALAAFALEGIADWPCRWLSAGQRRRLALARLLVTPAPLWLLDEPTTALDDDGQDRLAAVIAAHRAEGGMVMCATHTPLGLDAAAILALDAFAPRPGDLDLVLPGER